MYLKKRGKKLEDKDTLPQSIKKAEAATKPVIESDKAVPLEGGKYEVMELIGKGGYGKVYKCLSRETGEIFALKRINVKGSNKAESEAVEHEIQLLNTLSHPHIVKYEDSMRSGDFLDIVMEYVEGGQISSILKKFHGGPPEALIARYIAQVLKGLFYLHQQGVVHRDIKGANILSTKQGVIKLADFGVAAQLSSSSEQLHDAIGTPYWMAPEIIEMKSQMSPACDIWSVGCTVIELLTGNPPWSELPAMAAIYNIVNKDHPPLPEGISPFLQAFLMECFQKDPIRRIGALGLLKHPWLSAIPGALSDLPTTPSGFLEIKGPVLKSRSARLLRDDTPRQSSDSPTSLVPPARATEDMIRKFAEDEIDEGFEDFDIALQKVSVDKQEAKAIAEAVNWNEVDVDKLEESGSDTDPFDHFDEEENVQVDEAAECFAIGFDQAMGVLFPDEDAAEIVEGLHSLSSLLSQDPRKVRAKLLRTSLMSFMDLLELDNPFVIRATLACINNILYLPLHSQPVYSSPAPSVAAAVSSFPPAISISAVSTSSPSFSPSAPALSTASPLPTTTSLPPPSLAVNTRVSHSVLPACSSPSSAFPFPSSPPRALSAEGTALDETTKEVLESLISLGLIAALAKFTGSEFSLAIRCEAAITLKYVCLHNLSAFLSGGLVAVVRLLRAGEVLAEYAVDCISHAFEVTVNKTDLCRLCSKANILSPLIERLTLVNGLSSLPLPPSPPPSPALAIKPTGKPASSPSKYLKSGSLQVALNLPASPPLLSPPSPLALPSPMKELNVQQSAAYEASCAQREHMDRKVVYSTLMLTLVDFFASASPVVKLTFAKHDILSGLVRVMPRVSLPLKKIILRTFRQLFMDVLTLTAVVSAHALPSDLMAVLVEHLEHQDREVKSEALKSIYSLTSFNQQLQLSAAQAGVVPFLAPIIWANDHLSAFALPTLFHVASPNKETSALIQETGALSMLFALLKHTYHRVPALACIAQWVKVDPSVENEVLKEKNLDSLSKAFRDTKLAVQFEKLLESINMLVIVSDSIPSALAVDVAFREELMSRLRTTSSNAIRIQLLKILAPLMQLMPAPQPFIEATQLLPLLATLAKDESSSIVQKLASLIFELASGLAKVSHERRRTLVANAEGRSSRRVPKVATTWQPNESSLECNLCRSRFSIFNRRHHCRKCGALICSKCSTHRRPLADGEFVRMCDQCVQHQDRGEKPEKATLASGPRRDKHEEGRRAAASPPHYALGKQPHFELGDFVEVFGLQGSASYNGQKGTVVAAPGNARFEIQFGPKEVVRFKAANLRRADKP